MVKIDDVFEEKPVKGEEEAVEQAVKMEVTEKDQPVT